VSPVRAAAEEAVKAVADVSNLDLEVVAEYEPLSQALTK